MGPGGLEPPTPRLSSACSNQLSYGPQKKSQRDFTKTPTEVEISGADRIRTDDLLRARQALFQLSYDPRFEDHEPRRGKGIRLSFLGLRIQGLGNKLIKNKDAFSAKLERKMISHIYAYKRADLTTEKTPRNFS